MLNSIKRFFSYLLSLLCMLFSGCSSSPAILSENGEVISFKPYSKLTAFSKTLPDPFLKPDGTRVANMEEWERQREYIQKALCFYVYGERPDFSVSHVETESESDERDYGKTAVYRIFYDDVRYFHIRVTRPAVIGDAPYPVIMRYESDMDYRFPIEEPLLSAGRYVIVAIDHLDAAPDNQDEYTAGHMQESEAKAIMAWGYQATLTIDFLASLPYIDAEKIALTGHSRTGKAAICAAAFDERIALVVPNSSGAGGASSLRTFGQSGAQGVDIAEHQPSWVSSNLAPFITNVNKLPLDMHWATALIAPRPILFTESRDGADSAWANLRGTYACWSALDEVYKIYGDDDEMPLRNLIHTRAGNHDQLDSDYALLVEFCDSYFYGQPMDHAALRTNAEYPAAASQHKWASPF
ncbi:MAG: hypothetical protein LBS36_07740 [Oscillospiraceae bacterium]|nr:hypothetical protein [Oscillospiraceae bacterium]